MTTTTKNLNDASQPEAPKGKNFIPLFKAQIAKVPTQVEQKWGQLKQVSTETKSSAKKWALGACALILVIALFQNGETSSIDFLFWSFTAPKLVMYLLMMLIGVGIGIGIYKKLLDLDKVS